MYIMYNGFVAGRGVSSFSNNARTYARSMFERQRRSETTLTIQFVDVLLCDIVMYAIILYYDMYMCVNAVRMLRYVLRCIGYHEYYIRRECNVTCRTVARRESLGRGETLEKINKSVITTILLTLILFRR